MGAGNSIIEYPRTIIVARLHKIAVWEGFTNKQCVNLQPPSNASVYPHATSSKLSAFPRNFSAHIYERCGYEPPVPCWELMEGTFKMCYTCRQPESRYIKDRYAYVSHVMRNKLEEETRWAMLGKPLISIWDASIPCGGLACCSSDSLQYHRLLLFHCCPSAAWTGEYRHSGGIHRRRRTTLVCSSPLADGHRRRDTLHHLKPSRTQKCRR